MDLLFDKSEIARVIYESRVDMAFDDEEKPDADDTDVQDTLRREAKLSIAAADILWQEMEEAGYGIEFGPHESGLRDVFDGGIFQGGNWVVDRPGPSLDDPDDWLRSLGDNPPEEPGPEI